MTNFDYNRDIPDGPNNPSEDQPDLKVNTNSIDDLINEDHYSFGVNNGGFHKQVRMPNSAAIPGGLIANSGTLYTKSANGFAQLFYTNATSGNEYQLTRANNTNFSTFSTDGAYGTPPATFTQIGGWTFLPGGMLMQYGFFGKTGAAGTSGTIQFPIAFTTGPFSIQVTLFRNTGNQTISVDSATPPSTTSFKFLTSTAGSDGVYWTAIGK